MPQFKVVMILCSTLMSGEPSLSETSKTTVAVIEVVRLAQWAFGSPYAALAAVMPTRSTG